MYVSGKFDDAKPLGDLIDSISVLYCTNEVSISQRELIDKIELYNDNCFKITKSDYDGYNAIAAVIACRPGSLQAKSNPFPPRPNLRI